MSPRARVRRLLVAVSVISKEEAREFCTRMTHLGNRVYGVYYSDRFEDHVQHHLDYLDRRYIHRLASKCLEMEKDSPMLLSLAELAEDMGI